MKTKLVLALAACGLTSAALAGGLPISQEVVSPATSDAGIYLGLGLGYGHLSFMQSNEDTHTSYHKNNGFMGRVFLGYDINRFFAVEAGYSYFFNKPRWQYQTALVNETYDIKKVKVVDLMGKLKAPICEGFDIYAKLGANYLMYEKNRFNLAYGAGIDWSINNNVIAGIEWLRYNCNNKTSFETSTDGKVTKMASLNKTDAFMVTLRYRFDI